jgi:trans-aconitate methyltransferase
MQLADAVQFIQTARYPAFVSHWADLGCGSGTFTQALAHLLQPGSRIDAIDKASQNIVSKREQVSIFSSQADFVKEELPFEKLDGILMANSLHYVRDKLSLLVRLQQHLVEGGSFITIEYNTRQANPWVPYPLNEKQVRDLFTQIGFTQIKKLGERPSLYRRENLYAVQAFQ